MRDCWTCWRGVLLMKLELSPHRCRFEFVRLSALPSAVSHVRCTVDALEADRANLVDHKPLVDALRVVDMHARQRLAHSKRGPYLLLIC